MLDNKKQLNSLLEDPTFRRAFLADYVQEILAAQIRAIREHRGLTQEQLGEAAEAMSQVQISRLENPDYSGATVNSLRRIAQAFDIGLIIRYAPFSEFVDWVVNQSAESFAPASFLEEQSRLRETPVADILTEIVLPQLEMETQDSMIVRWLKKEGDPVLKGEPIVEMETDAVTWELESTATGILTHILAPEEAIVRIHTALAIIAAPGEQVPSPVAVASTPSPPVPATRRVSSSPAAGTGSEVIYQRAGETAAPKAAPGDSSKQAASQVAPAARRLAQRHGIDLSRIQGSGPRGRILIVDVKRAIQAPAQPPAQIIAMEGHGVRILP